LSVTTDTSGLGLLSRVNANRHLRANPAVVVAACYLAAAVIVTWRLWADPASRVVAGNMQDADQFAWFLRYAATAVAHGRLPALVTTALNAPQGVNAMWNTFILLPGVLLAPVTLAFGPQVSLTLLTTLGFAGSASALFYVLRRWGVSTGAAALAGAVYGFSPALVHSAIGHYDLQFAVLPPLIADRVLRLAIPKGRRTWLRDGVWLGVLCAAQLFIAEELLAGTALAMVLMVAVLAVGAPRLAWNRTRPVLRGLVVASGTMLALAGYPLWVQFFGPLQQHGSPFPLGTFQNSGAGFVTPSRYLLFHTAGSAAAAARFQYGAPEYLAYLGWPLLAALVAVAVTCRRHVAVAACAVVLVLLEILSLGAAKLVVGTTTLSLPWAWLGRLPLLGNAIPDRLSILAAGFAAAMLGFGLDALLARVRGIRGHWPAVALWSAAVVAVLPLTPLPLPSAAVTPAPAGWQTVFAALQLPAGARVLTVPTPSGWTVTTPMRWQADTGSPASLIAGYFLGADRNGHADLDGAGLRPTARYLTRLWQGKPPGPAPVRSQVEDDLRFWRPAAVVAVAGSASPVGRYLAALFGPPTVRAGQVIAWRLHVTATRVAAAPRPGS
jgi:hypothetical protein